MDQRSEVKVPKVEPMRLEQKKVNNGDPAPHGESRVLAQFSPQEQAAIQYKQQVLSSIAYFIGKDFRIPVTVGLPSEDCPSGWKWQRNADGTQFIQMNAHDLLVKPMDYLRFVTGHEGGHRRVSRIEDIPMELWRQPGFSFMMNAIEDPRTNNFVAEAYPKFKEQMELAYGMDLEAEAHAKEMAKGQLGYIPRFQEAGFEYIKQWFREVQGEAPQISEDLPNEVKEVVRKTLASARDSWLRYPSRTEADKDEDLIHRYAKVSFEINRDEIWPEFRKLVEQDMQDQQMQELMKGMQQAGQQDGQGDSGPGMTMPQGLKDALTPQEQQELQGAIQQALEQAGQPHEGQESGLITATIIDLDSLSEGLKQKLKEYVDSLPEDQKRKLEEDARKALQDFEGDLNQTIEGKLSDSPDKKAERVSKESVSLKHGEESPKRAPTDEQALEKIRDKIEEVLKTDENVYEQYRREVLPVIDELEQDLRELFVARRAQKWLSGFKSGKKIDIKRRIQEKAKGTPVVESKAWKKRELPQEKDYAITLLVDLSGSMQGDKIDETFKGAIVLAEVLNRLSIQTEILGFNDHLYVYQEFNQHMSPEIRAKMGTMLGEVDTSHARWNDDGWALQQASERLAKEKGTEKFIFVLSDGIPAESPQHPRSRYDLPQVVKQVTEDTDQKLVGLGIGPNTKHVESYYPSSIANINVSEMADKLADVLREVIANYDTF